MTPSAPFFVSPQSKETSPFIIPETNSCVSSHFVMGDTTHFYEGDE